MLVSSNPIVGEDLTLDTPASEPKNIIPEFLGNNQVLFTEEIKNDMQVAIKKKDAINIHVHCTLTKINTYKDIL